MVVLRYHRVTGHDRALAMVERTLTAMRRGGVYDQVGFGFHRYSTDRRRLVPHFEKMLYANALLALAYLEAYQSTGKAFHARAARKIFAYLLRDMRAPDGALAASQDADSDGRERAFYAWTLGEGKTVLGEASYIGAAAETADFVLRTLRRPDGRLLAWYREGEAEFPAYLDDHAFLTWGLIELWEATFEASYLEQALDLARAQIALFRNGKKARSFSRARTQRICSCAPRRRATAHYPLATPCPPTTSCVLRR